MYIDIDVQIWILKHTPFNANAFVFRKYLDLGFQTIGCEQARTHRADSTQNPAKRRQQDNKEHASFPSLSICAHTHIDTHIHI